MYRLGRNTFTIQSAGSAANQTAYWRGKTPAERLATAWYLIYLDIVQHFVDVSKLAKM